MVGAAAASCQVHEMGVGGLLLRFAWPAAALTYKGLARDSNTTQSRVAWVGWLHTGCERYVESKPPRASANPPASRGATGPDLRPAPAILLINTLR